MSVDLTGGHVSVTAGDLTRLRRDALLVPTDEDLRECRHPEGAEYSSAL